MRGGVLLAAALVALSLSGCLGETAKATPGPAKESMSQTRTSGNADQAQPGAAEPEQALPNPAPSARPLTVGAGEDRTLRDTDGDGREAVQLHGSASPRDGQAVRGYAWYEGSTKLDEAPLVLVQAPVGPHEYRFQAAYADGAAAGVAEDVVRVTVVPNGAPIAAAGSDQEAFDGDGDGRHTFLLDGRSSSDGDGTLAAYEWRVGSLLLLSGPSGPVTLAVGSHTVVLTVRDAGGSLATDTLQLQVHPNRDPAANAGSDRLAFLTGAALNTVVHLQGTGSDPDGLPLEFTWSRKDGAAVAESAHANVTVGAGTHEFVLAVRDAAGKLASDGVMVTVRQVAPLVPAIGSSSCSGLACSFDATASSGEAPLSFAWTFGDGTTGSGGTVSHAYGASGTYNVVLTVTDAAGRSASVQVQKTVMRASLPITFTKMVAANPLLGSFGSMGGILYRQNIDDAWVDLPADAQGRSFQLSSTGGAPQVQFLSSCSPFLFAGFTPVGPPFFGPGPVTGTVPAGAVCALLEEYAAAGTPSTISLTIDLPAAANIGLSSPAFQDGQPLPPQYSCTTGAEPFVNVYGGIGTVTAGGISPPLTLMAPPGTVSLVLGASDLGPTGSHYSGAFTAIDHWRAWNIPVPDGGRVELPAGASGSMPQGTVEGNSDLSPTTPFLGPAPNGYAGYSGLCDFFNDIGTTHDFLFFLVALDTTLNIPPNTSGPQLVAATEGHRLATATLSTTATALLL